MLTIALNPRADRFILSMPYEPASRHVRDGLAIRDLYDRCCALSHIAFCVMAPYLHKICAACALVEIHRATFKYTAHPSDDTALLTQIQELAMRHPRSGYRRISVLVNRRQPANQKRVRRLWRRHRLQVRRVVRKRTRRLRPELVQVAYPGHIWAYDFVEDALADGSALRFLTVIDAFTRTGLALDVAVTTSAERVIGVITALIAQYGAPAHLRSDNGAAFVATTVQAWLARRGVQTLSIEGSVWREERSGATWREEPMTHRDVPVLTHSR